MKNVFLILAYICVLIACSSKDLKRDQAKNILKNHPYPICVSVLAGPYSDQEPTKENVLLVKHGFGSMQRNPSNNYWTFIPNEKLKPYIAGTSTGLTGMVDLELLISKCEVDEIKGISKKSDSTCIVEYTSKLDDPKEISTQKLLYQQLFYSTC